MIVIGSFAAQMKGIRLPMKPADLDLVGTQRELNEFRTINRAYIQAEKHPHRNRAHLILVPGQAWKKIEFSYSESIANGLLAGSCSGETVKILDSRAYVPSVNLLYLTKRAHAHIPVSFQKTLAHLSVLKSHVTDFSSNEVAYYASWKEECAQRLEMDRSRFRFDVSIEKSFGVGSFVRTYERDDLYRAVSFADGAALREKCAWHLSCGEADQARFLALAQDDQFRLIQEEFMLVGLERFYLFDRSLPQRLVFRAGRVKAIRDLFPDWLREYCLDNIERLTMMPPHNFVGRFERAERNGELRMAVNDPGHAEGKPDIALRLFLANRLEEARPCFLDMSGHPQLPGNAAASYYLGRIARRAGRNGEAISWLRKAVEIDAAFAPAWNELGNARRAAGDGRGAAESYLAAIRSQRDLVPAYINLGALFEANRRYRRAIAAYGSALQRLGDYAPLRRRLRELVAREAARPPEVNGESGKRLEDGSG